MSVIIRLQNLPLTANSIDIRNFFRNLSIPDGGCHIVGGNEGDAFIAFSTDEDARQAMQLTGHKLKDAMVKLLLSSRHEMYKVIEQARLQALGIHPQGSPISGQGGENSTSSQSSTTSSNTNPNSSMVGHAPLQQAPESLNPNPIMMSNSGSNSGHPLTAGQGLGNLPSFPTGNMNLATGGAAAHFMPPGLMQNFPGIPTGPPPTQQQQQQHQFSTMPPNPQGMFSNRGGPNPTANPFMMQPNMSSVGNPMGFPGLIPNSANNSNSANAPGLGMGSQAGINPNGILGMPGLMNQHGQHNNPGIPGPFNMGGPPRLGAMNNPMGINNNNGMTASGASNNFMGMGGPPPGSNNFSSNFIPGSGNNNSNAPGGMGPGSRPPRPNFNLHSHQQQRPPGPMTGSNNTNNSNNAMAAHNNNPPRDRNLGMNSMGMGGHDRDNGASNMNMSKDIRDLRDRGARRSRSRSRDRRDNPALRRRRSRSRSRDRELDRSRDKDLKDRDRRRRRSRSKSRSRSRERGGRVGTRRTSRDKGRDERRKSESSPEKSATQGSDKSTGSVKRGLENDKRNRRDSDPIANSSNMTDEEHPCIKLSGLPKDASFREIREFVRVDIQGGGEGVVRQYDEGLAFLKLERASDFPKVYRSNGRKLRNSIINVEGISFDKWTQEYKSMKKEVTRDRDRERDRDRDFRDRERHDREKNVNPRTSRFNTSVSSSQLSCIAIRGLPPAITGKDVSSRLLRDAPVTDLLVVPAQNTHGRPSVTAFVNLDSPVTAQRAVDSIVRSQEGASLVVELCELEDMNQARRALAGGQTRDRDNRPAGPAAKSLFELDIGMDMDSSSVMLQGVPPNISDRDVFDFFSDIGLKPSNVRKMFDQHGSPNGQVICEFQDNHKARRATTKDGMMFGRNSITVTLIPSGGGTGEKQGFRNPHGGGGSRPSLLGVRPNGPANSSQNPRFQNPNPNPFVQAMQQSIMVPNPVATGMRSNGPSNRMRNPTNRMSRFDSRTNNSLDYEDHHEGGMGSRNGVDRDDRVSSTTRARGHNNHSESLGSPPDKLSVFKPGCIVALTNVPFKAEIEDIAKYLEGILKIQIPYDRIVRNLNDMGKSTGNARVAFQTSFEAIFVNDRLRGTTMWNRPIMTEVLSEIVWS